MDEFELNHFDISNDLLSDSNCHFLPLQCICAIIDVSLSSLSVANCIMGDQPAQPVYVFEDRTPHFLEIRSLALSGAFLV